jgi:sialic acid synthase SpsE
LKNRTAGRKSIVAARAIREGEAFSDEILTTKRPGNGISPMRWDELIGRKARRSYERDELIEL